MADLENRHADAWKGNQVALDLFEHGQGHHGWSGREIEDAMDGCISHMR
jgi:hypothetical protein